MILFQIQLDFISWSSVKTKNRQKKIFCRICTIEKLDTGVSKVKIYAPENICKMLKLQNLICDSHECIKSMVPNWKILAHTLTQLQRINYSVLCASSIFRTINKCSVHFGIKMRCCICVQRGKLIQNKLCRLNIASSNSKQQYCFQRLLLEIAVEQMRER